MDETTKQQLFETLVDEGVLTPDERPFWELLTPARAHRMIEVLEQRTRYIHVVLEAVDDGHNQAAILRSCDAFGVQHLSIVPGRGGFAPSKGVTQGADKWLTLERRPDIATAITAVQERGYRVWASRLDQHAVPIQEVDLRQPAALVFGNEHEGVSDEVVALADATFIVSMVGFVQSLNVSVAAAITLFHLTRRARRIAGADYFLTPDEKRDLLRRWLMTNSRGARRLAQAREAR